MGFGGMFFEVEVMGLALGKTPPRRGEMKFEKNSTLPPLVACRFSDKTFVFENGV